MAERLVRRDNIANALFQFGDFRKAALVLARPDELIAGTDVESAACAGDQGYAAKLILEGGEQFLRHPGGAQQPPALPAIFDLDPRAAHGRPGRAGAGFGLRRLCFGTSPGQFARCSSSAASEMPISLIVPPRTETPAACTVSVSPETSGCHQ